MNIVIRSIFLMFLISSQSLFGQELQAGDKYLSPAQIDELRKKAISGDGRSAYALADYYEFFENDLQESFFWTRLSAENGYCQGIEDEIGLAEHGHISKKLIPHWQEVLKKNKCSANTEAKYDRSK